MLQLFYKRLKQLRTYSYSRFSQLRYIAWQLYVRQISAHIHGCTYNNYLIYCTSHVLSDIYRDTCVISVDDSRMKV